MTRIEAASRRLLAIGALALLCSALHAAGARGSFAEIAQPFLRSYCLECHDADIQKGSVRLDQLDGRFADKDLDLWANALEVIDAHEMPPRKKAQPEITERQRLSTWILGELAAKGRDVRFERQFPAKGNYVPHELLFGPQARRVPAATPVRAWRLNPLAYKRQFADPFGFGADGRTALQWPYGLTTDRGLRDYAFRYQVHGPEIEQLAANAEAFLRALGRSSKTDDPAVAALLRARDKGPAPKREEIEAMVGFVFSRVRNRPPTGEEVARFATYAERRYAALGHTGYAPAFAPILLHPEAVYRVETGAGTADAHGRRLLEPIELAEALALALTDGPPDEALREAAAAGRLKNREDAAREAARLLAAPACGVLSGPAGKQQIVETSKTLRFFREYFDYTQMLDIFKGEDQIRKFKIQRYEPPEIVKPADTMVAYILEQDRDVLRTLLTMGTPADGFPDERWLQDRYARAEKGKEQKLVAKGKTLWPADRNRRTGMLMQKAWLISHSDNFDNHPIKRGRWIRERLLGGVIPDTPITVEAKLPDEPKSTLRERMRVTRAPECWTCHQRMDPLGLAFEGFNHFGVIRTEEQGKPPIVTGEIVRSGDPSLDGPVKDADELIVRLASSERVAQVFVRHAFRFYMGRNETLRDAGALQDCYAAYRDSGGSMRALIQAIVTSDAFLYRSAADAE